MKENERIEQLLSTTMPKSGWDGFVSAFTWQNIGLQLGNGLISGAAAWGIGALLDEITNRGERIETLLQSFADDIVRRVTENVRAEITHNTYKENMRKLKVSAASLARKFEAYEITKDQSILDNALNHAFDAVEEARSLGPTAIGAFQVVSGMKMHIFVEKGKTQPAYNDLISKEVKSASLHCTDLHSNVLSAAENSVGYWRFLYATGWQIDGEPPGGWYEIIVDGQRVTNWIPAEPNPNTNRAEARKRIIDRKRKGIKENIVEPSSKILEKWVEAEAVI